MPYKEGSFQKGHPNVKFHFPDPVGVMNVRVSEDGYLLASGGFGFLGTDEVDPSSEAFLSLKNQVHEAPVERLIGHAIFTAAYGKGEFLHGGEQGMRNRNAHAHAR